MSGIKPIEIYTQLPGYPGSWVSNHGGILSAHAAGGHGGICNQLAVRVPDTSERGYKRISLIGTDGRRKHRFVHDLILEAFVGPRPPGMICRHLDGDPSNNLISNLRWGTGKENSQDCARHGRTTRHPGEKHPLAKLTEEDVREIKLLIARGISQREIGKMFGVRQNTISRVNSGVRWGHMKPPSAQG